MGALQQQHMNREDTATHKDTDTDTATNTETATNAVSTSRAEASRSRSMPVRSILILALCSLLLPATEASPVFVDNPSLAQCKYSDCETNHTSLRQRDSQTDGQTVGQTERQSSTRTYMETSHSFSWRFSSELQHFLSRRLLKLKLSFSRLVFWGASHDDNNEIKWN